MEGTAMKYLAFLGLTFVPAASIAVSSPGTEFPWH